MFVFRCCFAVVVFLCEVDVVFLGWHSCMPCLFVFALFDVSIVLITYTWVQVPFYPCFSVRFWEWVPWPWEKRSLWSRSTCLACRVSDTCDSWLLLCIHPSVVSLPWTTTCTGKHLPFAVTHPSEEAEAENTHYNRLPSEVSLPSEVCLHSVSCFSVWRLMTSSKNRGFKVSK
jgi:hypothetical protein